MPNKDKYHLLYAILINAALFTLFLLFTHPIYDTNEDVYILYRLSGGFGTAPTELLHYNYGMHPYLGLLLKNLFELTNEVNWYTIALLLSHFIACTVLLFHILSRYKPLTGITAYLLLFIVFECQLLLTLNFSNSSLLLGCAGFIILAQYAKAGNRNYALLIGAGTCIVLASFFRVHVLVVAAVIAAPFLVLLAVKQKRISTFVTIMIIAGIVLFFNQLQQGYYNRHIPNWKKEEAYRQHIYRFYNNFTLYTPSAGEKWFTENGLIQNGLSIDTSFLSASKLNAMYTELNSRKRIQPAAEPGGKNWIWINNRIFLFSFLLLLTFPAFNRRLAFIAALTALLYISGYIWLLYNLKTSGYLLTGAALFFITMVLLFGSERKASRRLFDTVRISIAILLMTWGIVRIYKVDQKNRLDNQKFVAIQQELQSYPNQLFINTPTGLPFQKYYIFHTPKNFPLTNLLENEFFLHGDYRQYFTRLGINYFAELPKVNMILFLGDRIPALENYFNTVAGKPVKVIGEAEGLNTVNAYRILYK